MENQNFCLKWESFQSNVTSVFEDLRQEDELVDITLCCEGERFPAHRMMLSACSPYFRDVLKNIPCQHMVFYMRDTSASDLRALLEFMYKGKVNVTQNQLGSFIRTAESLQIRGLSGDEDSPEQSSQQRSSVPDQPRSSGSERVSNKRPSTHYNSPISGGNSGFAGGFESASVVDRHHSTSATSGSMLDTSSSNAPSSGPHAPNKRRRRASGAHSGAPREPAEIVDLEDPEGSDHAWPDHLQQPPSPHSLHPPMAAAWTTEAVESEVNDDLVNTNAAIKTERNMAGTSAASDTAQSSPSLQAEAGAFTAMPADSLKVEKVDIVESGDDMLEFSGSQADCEGYSDSDRSAMDSLMLTNMSASAMGVAGPSQMLSTDDPQSSQAQRQCSLCGLLCKSMKEFHHHRRMHDGSTTCVLCQRVFSRVWVLHRHMKLLGICARYVECVSGTRCLCRITAGFMTAVPPAPAVVVSSVESESCVATCYRFTICLSRRSGDILVNLPESELMFTAFSTSHDYFSPVMVTALLFCYTLFITCSSLTVCLKRRSADILFQLPGNEVNVSAFLLG